MSSLQMSQLTSRHIFHGSGYGHDKTTVREGVHEFATAMLILESWDAWGKMTRCYEMGMGMRERLTMCCGCCCVSSSVMYWQQQRQW
jgi:hypothetical protein